MNNRKTLSIAPYYGGKGRMAHFIADRLDYSDSKLFVTPFGGMCRELLNKPRHKIECYNDYNSALCALMCVLSNPEDADILIHRLYDETEFDEEIFYEQKAIYDSIEIDMEEQESQKIRKFLIDNKFATPYTASKLLNEIGEYIFAEKRGDIVNASGELVKLQTAIKADKEFEENFQKLIDNWYLLYEHRKLHEGDGNTSIYFNRPAEMGVEVDDIDLAVATFVVFTQSRDGMGKTWSEDKFKNPQQYKNRILRLYDCAERLDGISVYNIDALDFFRRWEHGKNSGTLSCVMNGWMDC